MTDSVTRRAGERYATVAILLHWAIAALIVLQIVIAGRMEGRTPEAFAVIQLHKSVGVTVLLLTIVRIAWRLLRPPPPEPPTLKPWERRLSSATHLGFYGVMLLMPITGWMIVSASRTVIPTLLYGQVPWPNLPGFAELTPAARHMWHEGAETAHGLIIKGAYVLIALHVAGALKHQLLGRDTPVLGRMAPGAVAGRWLEPRLALIALGAAGVIAFGDLYQPPRPATAPAAVLQGPPAAPTVSPLAAEPVSSPKAPAGAVRWQVLPGSSVGFGTEWSGTRIEGRFRRWTADVVFAPEDLAHSRVSVTIDTASADTGDAQRDQSLPAPDWFDTGAHPKATFAADRFEATGPGRYVAHGVLTLRGVSRPLALPFRLEIDGDTATVSGVTSLDRTAFGVGQGEWTNTDQIPAKVTVRVALKARRAST